MISYQIVNLGFSTADGEDVAFHFRQGDVEFTFTDWQERRVRFLASDVRALSWAEESEVKDIRDDTSYEVINSDVISRYRALNLMSDGEVYRHYKLCFNAAGVFDVVCSRITLTDSRFS